MHASSVAIASGLFTGPTIVVIGVVFLAAVITTLVLEKRNQAIDPIDLGFLRGASAALEGATSYAEWLDIIDRVADFAADYRWVDPNTLPAEECEAVELARQILEKAHSDETAYLELPTREELQAEWDALPESEKAEIHEAFEEDCIRGIADQGRYYPILIGSKLKA